MPEIRPLSDLRNYNALLDEVTEGSPVFLTRNGRGAFAILDIRDYQRIEAERKLFEKIQSAEHATEKFGAYSAEETQAYFDKKFGR